MRVGISFCSAEGRQIMASYSKHILRNIMVVVLTCLSSFGCTDAQLRRGTVAQSMTLSDIYTQQVLNNLAMFVQNPNSLPFFAFPNQGTTSIQDTGNIGNPGYSSGHFSSSPFILNASRQATENWVLVPVSDPAKLALMRCAYQQAIASTMSLPMNDGAGCPDCAELRGDFYGPKVSATRKPDSSADSPCLDFPPWFTWGCEKHAKLPKNRACQTIGSYCGIYVCVPPECRDMLTRLTMTILDYAVNDPTQFTKRTKDVELHLDENGGFTSTDAAVKTIKATIPIDQKSDDLRILDNGTVWLEFFEKGFKKKDADDLVRAATKKIEKENEQKAPKDRESPPELLNRREYWEKLKPIDDPLVAPGIVEFFNQNAKYILPQQAPSEELLKGPSTFQRKGAASAGLQMLQQRLKAVSGG